MKKISTIMILVLILSFSVSAQEYWNLRTSAHGIIAKPGDENGMVSGFGARFMFGPQDSDNSLGYDLGFEVEKWYRSFYLPNSLMDSLQAIGEIPSGRIDSKNEQGGLSFSAMAHIKLMKLSIVRPYLGAGLGFYFLQSKREEARRDDEGYWNVSKIDHYLETKFQGFTAIGFEGNLFGDFYYYMEGEFSYITNWERWDNPYLFSGCLGIRYGF